MFDPGDDRTFETEPHLRTIVAIGLLVFGACAIGLPLLMWFIRLALSD